MRKMVRCSSADGCARWVGRIELCIEAIRKAEVLIQALGYIRTFRGRFTVIKLGGSVMEEPGSLRALLVDVVFMQTVGMRRGGSRRRQGDHGGDGGRRLQPTLGAGPAVTDEATLEIVARVLAEEINADIERHIGEFGGRASGLTTRPTSASSAASSCFRQRGSLIDLGRVGEVTEVDIIADREPLPGGRRAGAPVAGPGRGGRGQLLNVNADTAAAAVAQALKAEKLVFLTDTPGILRDRDEPASLISGLTPRSATS